MPSDAATFTTISYDVADRVAHVRLIRPEGANAVNMAFAQDLRNVMREIALDDGVRAVAVTAEGKVFCAGGDLKEFDAQGDALPSFGTDLVADFHVGIYRMNRMPKPVVAAVGGAAGGAGLSLMSAFDLVIASESAKFTMAYTRAAMTPDGTSTYFLARHIGLRRAMDLTLTNRVLSAAEAESWGLVNQVVPDGEADQAAIDLATRLANGAAGALGRAKRLIYEGYESQLEEAGEREAAAIIESMKTTNGREGINAFVQKRQPDFG